MGLNGNVGNKNSGRKTIKEEVDAARELITQEALIALANNKVYKQLKKINEDNELEGFIKTKDMALPITLKGITEKRESNINVKFPVPIDNVLPNIGIPENKTTK